MQIDLKNDSFVLQNTRLTITHDTQSESKDIDEKVIKQSLGFFERIGNFFTWITGGDFWDIKEVTKDGQNQPMWVKTKTIQNIFRENNPTSHPSLRTPLLSEEKTSRPSVAGQRNAARRNASETSTRNSPASSLSSDTTLTGTPPGSRSPSPNSRSSSPISLGGASGSPKARLNPQQRALVKNGNRLVGWILELQEEGSKVKGKGKGELSIEPRFGVKHDKIDPTSSTGIKNILLGTFQLVRDMSQKNEGSHKWEQADDTAFPFDLGKFTEACDQALKEIKTLPEGDDKIIKQGVVTAARLLSSRFQSLESGTKKDEKMFIPNRSESPAITNYMEKFDDYGIN